MQKTKDALEVVVIGLSHHNAKVDVREKLAIPEDQWNEAATVSPPLPTPYPSSYLSLLYTYCTPIMQLLSA